MTAEENDRRAAELAARIAYFTALSDGGPDDVVAARKCTWEEAFAALAGPPPELGKALAALAPSTIELDIDVDGMHLRWNKARTAWWAYAGKQPPSDDGKGHVVIYDVDAYPDMRGNVWAACYTSLTGQGCRGLARALCDDMRRRGVDAKLTIRRGTVGVAFKVPA